MSKCCEYVCLEINKLTLFVLPETTWSYPESGCVQNLHHYTEYDKKNS